MLLCGTDMFLTLDTWYCPEEIFALAEIVYMRREEDAAVAEKLQTKAEQYREKYAATVRELIFRPLEISSTDLRSMIAEGRDTTNYLHPAVREYIEQCQLYRI